MVGSRLPTHARAIISALHFSSPDPEPFKMFNDEDWNRALEFSDQAQLTLPLGSRCREHLPEWVRARIDRNLSNNADRWKKMQATYQELTCAFERKNIETAVLKGFSHCPLFISDPRLRPQGDLDLLLCKEQAAAARDAALTLGYEPLGKHREGRIDHLPAMIRKTGWQWRGDYFDLEIPISLELHFRLWDEETEQFAPSGLEYFWERREKRAFEHFSFTALHSVDSVAYASLHLLRHLLRGDLRAFHVYEMAAMLHQTSLDQMSDAAFWSLWAERHDPSLTRLEAIGFSLAQRWFDCRMSTAARDAVESLDPEITRWLDIYADSPLTTVFSPNKDELWLHWNLVDSSRGRFSILRRRLLPVALPGVFEAAHVPDNEVTWRLRLRRGWKFLTYTASRVWHHLRAFPATGRSAMEWFWQGRT